MGNVLKLISNWSHQSEKHSTVVTSDNGRLPNQSVYSWDMRPGIETGQFRMHNLVHQFTHRALIEQGQQLTIESCSQTLITISGYSDSVFVDDCTHCKIILGPVKGSVFLRNCEKIIIVSASGQFRTRDCSDVTCYLFCPSQPSIETSVAFQFQCVSINYPGFHDHLDKAGLMPTITNRWSDVFDFSSTSLKNNWTLMPVEDRLENHLTEEELEHCNNRQISFNRPASAVPFTHPAMKQSRYDGNWFGTERWDISEGFYNFMENNSQ